VPAAVSATEFVEFWRRFYTDTDAAYFGNIGPDGNLATDNVLALMRWKSGPRHETRAEGFGRAVPLQVFNDARAKRTFDDVELRAAYDEITHFLRRAGHQRSDGIIWRIFLCHIAQPQTTPIYDVNVWRAWGFIEEWLDADYLAQRPNRFATYLDYRRWFNGLVSTYSLDSREVDRALMAFGQFLGSRWRGLL